MSRQYGVFWPSFGLQGPISGERRHSRAPRGAYFKHLSNTSSTQVLDCSNTSSCQSNSQPYPGNPRLLKSTTPVLQCSHARSASTVVTRPWWAATQPTTAMSRPWTRYARRDFARKMGSSGPNGPHRKPPLRGGMLRMSWRYAPWSTRLVR